MTSLRGIDGQVYSVAQGPVVTGGFSAGGTANTQTVNHPTLGRIPSGAIVERPSPAVAPSDPVRLQLHQADFTTAARIADAVNQHFSPEAKPAGAGGQLRRREHHDSAGFATRTTEFVAELEQLPVQTDRPARVVINERTGTIVMGKEVHVSPVAIMHGNLTVEIQTTFNVSQPAPFSQGSTQVVPQVGVGVKEEKARNVVLKEGATVEELVRALTSIGSTPRDIIAILQSLHAPARWSRRSRSFRRTLWIFSLPGLLGNGASASDAKLSRRRRRSRNGRVVSQALAQASNDDAKLARVRPSSSKRSSWDKC